MRMVFLILIMLLAVGGLIGLVVMALNQSGAMGIDTPTLLAVIGVPVLLIGGGTVGFLVLRRR